MQLQVVIDMDGDFDALSVNGLGNGDLSRIERQIRDVILNEGITKEMIKEL